MPSPQTKLTEALDILVEYGYLDEETPYHKALSNAVMDFAENSSLGGKYNKDYVMLLQNEAKKELKLRRRKISADSFKKGSSVGRAQNVAADTTGASALAKAGQPGALQQADAISQSPVESPGLLNAVQAIAASVDNIVGILKGQADAQRDAVEDARVAGEEKEAKGREKGLETKVFTGLKKVGEKIMKPVKSLWDKLLNFITTVLLGRALVKFLEWFGKPGNQEKIMSLFKFLKDWWPAIVAGLIAFASPLLGPVGVIAGVVALLMWGVPKIMDVAKYIGGLTGKIFSFLKGGPKGDNKIDTTTTPSGMSRQEARHGKRKDDTPTELKQGEQQQQKEIGQVPEPVAEMASGGQVPGSGNKDTVPAMLTPGEFVMSKGAVQKWGAGTLASMNAAGGGTNRPTMMFSGGGATNKSMTMYRGGGSVLQSTTSNFNIRGGYRGGGLITRPLKVQGFAGGGEVVGDSGDPNMELAPVQKLQEEISPPGGDPEAKAAAGEAAKSKRSRTQSSPGTSIPDFSASTMISPDKIKTLGISV